MPSNEMNENDKYCERKKISMMGRKGQQDPVAVSIGQTDRSWSVTDTLTYHETYLLQSIIIILLSRVGVTVKHFLLSLPVRWMIPSGTRIHLLHKATTMISQVLASCLLLIRAMSCRAFLPVPLTSSRTADYVKRFGHQQVAELVTGSIPWNSIVGQADRAFRLGITLEKNGQSRKASAAFHEAATLYQCFLDSKAEFGHVTCLDKDDCSTILAYACLRLGFLNLDALGDPLAAVRLFKEAAVIDPFPSAVTYKSIGKSLEAARGGKSLLEAIDAYQTCLKIQPEDKNTQFNLAVALDRLGQSSEAEELLEGLRPSFLFG